MGNLEFGLRPIGVYAYAPAGRRKERAWGIEPKGRNWGSNLRLTLVEEYKRSNVDLTPNVVKQNL